MKKWLLRVVCLVLLIFDVPPLFAQTPSCLKNYSTDLLEIANVPRRHILVEVNKMGRPGQQGVGLFLEYRAIKDDAIVRLADVLENLKYANVPVPSRFATPEEFFVAVRNLHARTPEGIPGFGRVFAEAGQTGNRGLAQGALFELYVADASGVGIQSFRAELNGNGFAYIADHVTVTGKRREVKAIFQPYGLSDEILANAPIEGGVFRFEDVRLDSLSEEMSRILLTNEGQLADFGFEFAEEVRGQDRLLKALLLKQLDAPRLRTALSPAVLTRLSQEVEQGLSGLFSYR